MSFQRTLLCLATVLLASCSSLSVRSPSDKAVILSTTSPPTVPVVVEGLPSLTTLTMKSGRTGSTDVTGQMSRTSTTRSEGQVAVDPGSNKLVAEANVPCWWCSGGSTTITAERNICVYSGPLSIPGATVRSVAPGALTWSLGSAAVVTANSAGAVAGPAQRWVFRQIGRLLSNGGQIYAAANPCLCMQVMETRNETPIGMVKCDESDLRQLWTAFRAPVPGAPPEHLRIQSNALGSNACLTQAGGPGTLVVQRDCNDTPEQLWIVRDNASGQDQTFPFR